MIQKSFRTGNFLGGLAFLTKVAVYAEGMNHHPDVNFTYPRVTLQLSTHDAGGLTEKEASEVLNISVATLKRDWDFARTWLAAQLTPGP